jgi:uncharacterized membrane protein YvbJ
MPPEICPHCGAVVPPRAKACPECGSDEQTGWSEDTASTEADLPDDHFDYEKFVEREFGGKKAVPEGIHWIWWVAGIILIIALIVLWVL